METLWVRPYYVMLQLTWNATRYLVMSPILYGNAFTVHVLGEVKIIVNEELKQRLGHIFKLSMYLLCLAGRNLWTSSPLYAGIFKLVIISIFYE